MSQIFLKEFLLVGFSRGETHDNVDGHGIEPLLDLDWTLGSTVRDPVAELPDLARDNVLHDVLPLPRGQTEFDQGRPHPLALYRPVLALGEDHAGEATWWGKIRDERSNFMTSI